MLNDTAVDPAGHQDPASAALNAKLTALDASMLVAIENCLDLDGGLAEILHAPTTTDSAVSPR